MELTGYSEIGAVLRTAREDRHLSLHEVARQLHIRARYLEALESGDFTQLPGIPYAKGYIQAYAVYLELDKDELMRRFERIDGQLAKRNFTLPKAFHSEKKPHQAAIWGSMAALLLLYSLWQVFFNSPQRHISVVEHFEPRISPELRDIASKALNPACFRVQEQLYPPCYFEQPEPEFTLVPLRGTPDTVLALWDDVMAKGQQAEIARQAANKARQTTIRPNDNEFIIKAPDLPEG